MRDVAEDPGRAYHGTAPTLAEVRQVFGGDADAAWLCTLLDNFIVYCGKGSMTGLQLMGIAQRLSIKSHLKVTEFMLFFWRLSNAEYGRVYGTVDPLFIMDSFNKFLKQRERERSEYAITTTDDISPLDDLPVMKPEVFYRMAMNGELAPEIAEIALKTLGPY